MIFPTRFLTVLIVCAGLMAPGGVFAESTHYSPKFHVGGEVQTPETYTVDTLKELPATKLDVYFNTGAGPVNTSFTGVLLWDLLTTAGVVTDPAIKNDILHKEVVAIGSDGYRVVFSLGELDPHFGGQQVIVAYLQNGQPLDASSGATRLIVPGDKAGGRDVSWLVALDVVGSK